MKTDSFHESDGRRALPRASGGAWTGALASAAALIVSFLPNLTCPACWPAYVGLLSSLGLGFLTEGVYLLPLTVILLIAALGSLAWQARPQQNFGPFGIGLLGAAAILVGKFALNWPPLWYLGVALLMGAAGWNAWPRKHASVAIDETEKSCSACVCADTKQPKRMEEETQ